MEDYIAPLDRKYYYQIKSGKYLLKMQRCKKCKEPYRPRSVDQAKNKECPDQVKCKERRMSKTANYGPKICKVCGDEFKPGGPRQVACNKCRSGKKKPAPRSQAQPPKPPKPPRQDPAPDLGGVHIQKPEHLVDVDFLRDELKHIRENMSAEGFEKYSQGLISRLLARL